MKCAPSIKVRMPRVIALVALTTLFAYSATASWAVVIKDGFGDGDRNNDGVIGFYDTDVNLSDTFNQTTGDPNNPGPDETINNKGLIEVTSAEDASDVGIVWSATRGFTSSNSGDPKANLKIVNDNVPTGSETNAWIHGNGYALGYEAKGTGSSMIGAFGQSVAIGPNIGNRIRVSIDMRFWIESNNPTGLANPGEIRWGLFQDTDNELGTFDNAGKVDPNSGIQASVEWGAEDGDWRSNSPGPEGDKGIWTEINTGPNANAADMRIKFENNVAGINGTSNNGRFLEGSGASNTVGSGGDVGTVASPSGDGPGGTIATIGTHTLTMDFIRVEDPSDPNNTLVQVASFVDGNELLRDEIKPGDTGAAILQPAPESFDYIALRNSSGDVDYVFDNFVIRNLVPEPTSLLLVSMGGFALLGYRRR